MNKNIFQKYMLLLVILMMTFTSTSKTMAQRRVADKELIGVWLMESMQFEGEEKITCGKDYSQIKVYRANGEYACAELVKSATGTCTVLPHEYGKYTFRNGRYTEMGRPGIVVMDNKTTFHGKWKNRHDVWKKTAVPAKLVNFIVEKCKVAQNNSNVMQYLMKRYIFTK